MRFLLLPLLFPPLLSFSSYTKGKKRKKIPGIDLLGLSNSRGDFDASSHDFKTRQTQRDGGGRIKSQSLLEIKKRDSL